LSVEIFKGGNKNNQDRFVTSYTLALTTTEKANSDERVTVAEESNDIQGSEENRSDKQHSTAATANNSIF
jgi:hypothetical protein